MYRFILVVITLLTLTSASFFKWTREGKSLQSAHVNAIFNKGRTALVFDFDGMLLPRASTSQGIASTSQGRASKLEADIKAAREIISMLLTKDKAAEILIITESKEGLRDTFRDVSHGEPDVGNGFTLVEENGRMIWSRERHNLEFEWLENRDFGSSQPLIAAIRDLDQKGIEMSIEDMGLKMRISHLAKQKKIVREKFRKTAEENGYKTNEVDDTSLEVEIYNKEKYVADFLKTGNFASAISFSDYSIDEGIHQAMKMHTTKENADNFISVFVGDETTKTIAKYRLKNLEELREVMSSV